MRIEQMKTCKIKTHNGYTNLVFNILRININNTLIFIQYFSIAFSPAY